MPTFIVDENRTRRTLRIDRDSIAVGRSSVNDITLTDHRASRRHCRIEKDGDGYTVVDLGSQNGTIVNDALVDRRALRPGDAIVIGSARIWFERAPRDAPEDPALETAPSGAPVDLDRENLVRLQRIAKALNSELDLDRLLAIIMDHVVELTNAERGFLAMVEGDAIDIVVARNFEKEAVQTAEGALSRSIVESVRATGEPVLAANAVEDERFRAAQSIADIRLRSVLCIPFRLKGRVLGIVYIDNRLQKGAFTRSDLRMLASLADSAAIAIENAHLYRENVRKARELERLNAELSVRVRTQADELTRIREELTTRQLESETKYDYSNIVGRSPRMREMLRLLDRIVETEEPVLIEGESGTGKELIAHGIHFKGPRRARRFLSQNCAAIPETLLESELFGHVRGAFTGADRDKKGLFELADKGTLFLDEIGDMSAEMQKRLLRVLQEKEIRAVGGKDVVKVDVRILSASNQGLKSLVDAGRFREDLYYRVKVFSIRIPPLRERREDIPLLVEHFLRLHTPDGRAVKVIEPRVMDRLLAYDWPGNVRELENEVKTMIALSDERITEEALSEAIRSRRPAVPAAPGEPGVRDLVALVERVEREEIEKALALHGGNKSRAAEALGISRFTLQRKIQKYGLEG